MKLLGPIDGDSSDFDMETRGQASQVTVRNRAILGAARGVTEGKRAEEKAWNSPEGQAVMGATKATIENKEARAFGDALEQGVRDMDGDADPARRARFEQRIKERANILGASIEKQLNFMGENAKVSRTKRLETPAAQKVFEEAFARPPQINPAGWK